MPFNVAVGKGGQRSERRTYFVSGVQVMWAIAVVDPNDGRVYVGEVAASNSTADNPRVSATVHTFDGRLR